MDEHGVEIVEGRLLTAASTSTASRGAAVVVSAVVALPLRLDDAGLGAARPAAELRPPPAQPQGLLVLLLVVGVVEDDVRWRRGCPLVAAAAAAALAARLLLPGLLLAASLLRAPRVLHALPRLYAIELLL